jgi:WD40 repeat protein
VFTTSAWTSDGRAVTLGSVNGQVIQWYIEDSTIHSLQSIAFGFPVRAIGVSSFGQNIAWVLDETNIVLWRSEEPLMHSYFFGEHTDVVVRVAFSPDGSYLASISDVHDPLVVIWDVETGRLLHKLELDEGHFPFSIAFSPDGSVLAVGQFLGSIELWNVESGEQLSTLTGLTREVVSIVWASHGRQLAASSSFWFGSSEGEYDPYLTIGAWDIESGELIYAREGSPASDKPYGVYKIAVSPNGEWLASGTDSGEIRLWNFESGELLDTLDGHTDYVFDLAWSPGGQMLASVSADNTVIVWDNPLDASD